MRGYTWLATELAIGIISFLCCAFALDQTFLASLALAPRLVQWHLIGLVVTALAYRLSPLHPLYKYPGPRVAKCTSLYMTHVVWSGNRYKVYLELHRRYGDFVRIGPNTISINRHDIITSVYNAANCWNKTDAYHLSGLSGAGLFFIEDLEEHNKRKRHWAPAFTTDR
ncbi:hypothetical protein BJ165DRAFT_835792 [Panaeolus papilionaceus]|nr:hypothetical protein BJ165DRAFT_835792 [Panaeolus papilionaceus]